LTGADYTDASRQDEFYSYDANGNRVASHLHREGYITGPANQLLSDGEYNYEYNAEGSLVRRQDTLSGQVQLYEWDHRNHLRHITTYNEVGEVLQVSELTYDVFGRTIGHFSSASLPVSYERIGNIFVHDGEHVRTSFKGVLTSGQLNFVQTRRMLHGSRIDEIFAEESNETFEPSWTFSDHTVSVLGLFDDLGRIADLAKYDAFGNLALGSDANTLHTFNGRISEAPGNFVNIRARRYDTNTGSFISEDPLRHGAQDTNLRRFAGNSPIIRYDPWGLETQTYATEQAAAIAAIGSMWPKYQSGVEWGGWIVRTHNGRFAYTRPYEGTLTDCPIILRPQNDVAFYHTHPYKDDRNSDIFSEGDDETFWSQNIPVWYLGGGEGTIWQMTRDRKTKILKLK
jgi:RHS repeat-associated protein